MDIERNLEEKNSKGIISSMNEDIKNETIGSFLKKSRLDKSLSLDAISRHTKINKTNLEALETNNKKALPNIAYVKGFVKAYSKILDVDLNFTLGLLDDLYQKSPKQKLHLHESVLLNQAHKIEASKTNVHKKSEGLQIDNDLKLKIFGATAAIAIVGLIFFSRETKEVVHENSEITTESVSAHSPLTTETIQEDISISTESLVAEDSTELALAAPIEKEETVIEKVLEVKKEEPIVKKVEVKAKEKIEDIKEIKENESVKSDDDEVNFYNFSFPIYTVLNDTESVKTYVPASQINSIQDGKQNVFITAIDGDSWITYKKDSDDVKKFVLKQGRFLTIRGDDVRVFLGNANATKIFLNNKLIDIQTTSGVKSLVFPEIKAKELKLPLFIYNKDGTVTPSDEYRASN